MTLQTPLADAWLVVVASEAAALEAWQVVAQKPEGPQIELLLDLEVE